MLGDVRLERVGLLPELVTRGDLGPFGAGDRHADARGDPEGGDVKPGPAAVLGGLDAGKRGRDSDQAKSSVVGGAREVDVGQGEARDEAPLTVTEHHDLLLGHPARQRVDGPAKPRGRAPQAVAIVVVEADRLPSMKLEDLGELLELSSRREAAVHDHHQRLLRVQLDLRGLVRGARRDPLHVQRRVAPCEGHGCGGPGGDAP